MTSSALPRTGLATDEPGDHSPFALGLVLRRAHDRAASALLGALRPQGLELRHFAVLIALNTHGAMSQSGLVQATSGDKASMVRNIDELERLGIVERKPFPGDRRIHAIELTAHGLEVFDAVHIAAGSITAALVSHLDYSDADRLLELLIRFTYPDTALPTPDGG